MKKVLLVFICIIMLALTTACVNKSSASYLIGSDMIEVLNSYKNGNITAKDAGNQMDELSEKANSESEIIADDDFDESHRLSMISIYARNAYTDLYFKETMSISDINECIREIEKVIS